MANEKRLIYQEDAIKLLRGKCVAKYPSTFIMGLFAAADEVAKLPTVDAVEVVHGRWERIDKRYVEMFKCSICRSECYVPTCMGEPMYDYCPNCGAKMDGDGK